LPEILTENFAHQAEFKLFRKEYEENYRYSVDALCEYAKYRFYDVLLQEADTVTRTAIDPAAAFRMLKDEVRAKLSEMLKQLRDAISQVSSPAAHAPLPLIQPLPQQPAQVVAGNTGRYRWLGWFDGKHAWIRSSHLRALLEPRSRTATRWQWN
jgi:hypothetical protein